MAERHAAIEYGTERPCEVGRITYRIGSRDYVALAFRYTDGSNGEKLPWFLTWLGAKDGDTARLPAGIEPNLQMLAALEAAPLEEFDAAR